jgi:YbbR domain-containing protein
MTSNLGLKAVSLALAGLLWFAIAGEKTSEMGISVPVELQNVPKDLELTGDTVNNVEVRLRASPGIIQRLGPGEVSARLDLKGASEGERIIHLTNDAIRVPFGIQVVQISPSMITLNFERTAQKLVPVRPRMVGRPAQGFEVAEIVSEPAEVRIAGPKSRVQEVESAFTEPVSLEGAQASVTDVVSLGIEDPMLRILDRSRVQVTAKVRAAQERRTLQDLPIRVRGGALTPRPATVDVVVSGPVSVMARLKPGDVRPWVDGAAAEASGRAPVAVELAPGLTGISVDDTKPAEVTLRPARRSGPG